LKIGIIGAGNIGGALARRLSAIGHIVTIANSRGPDSLTELASETGVTPVPIADIAHDADMVIVAIPESRIPELPPGLFRDLPDRTVIVDTGNYLPQQRDGRIDDIEDGTVESRWTERHLGHPRDQGIQHNTPRTPP
jgi:predicted dinucleotide-binding enzyme